jgi:ABC-type glycerol-3-phosphate transport system substrate-binding protein
MKSRMKKTCIMIFALLFLFSLGTVFAGGGKEDTSGSGAGGSIEYVSMWNAGEPAADYFEVMAEKFEEETGITVNMTFAGRDVLTKIRSRLLMKDAPDLVDHDFSELSGALLRGDDVLIRPINDFLYDSKGPEGQGKFMDIFNEGHVKLYELGGNIYFFPYQFITSGFFYDKTLFSKHGLSAPGTWSEFIKNNEVLKSKGIPPLALDGNISFYNAYYYYWALTRVMGPGNLKAAAADKTGATWDNPGYLKAAQLVQEISAGGKGHFQSGYSGSNFPAAQADWALNQMGSILCGTWIPVETRDQQTDSFKVGFYPFPEVAGGKGTTTDVEAYLIGFAVPKDAKNYEGAKEFMKFISKKENANIMAQQTANIAARTDATYPELLADVKPVLDNAKSFHVSYDGVMQLYPEWFANIFYPLDNDLVFGTITAEEFIQKIKQNSMDFWKSK